MKCELHVPFETTLIYWLNDAVILFVFNIGGIKALL